MKSVLITGVAGFLGRYVARQFAQDGWQVFGIDEIAPENVQLPAVTYRRLSLPSDVLGDWLREITPQVCVHCAGRASVGLSMEDPRADFQGNVVLVFEVLEALRRVAPQCRFLFLSSAAVYGNPAVQPVAEEHAILPLSPYGYHKRQAELLCEEFTRIHGVPTASVRIFSAYGAGLRRQVIWDICAKIIGGGKLELHGTGAESRDFVHAADIARALVLLASDAPCDGEVYNFASGREVTIAELADALVVACGADVRPVFNGAATPGNPLHWRADISRIAALGFAPATSLEEGIRGVAQWCAAELGGRLRK